ncbi:MAG: UDP-N-acetylmuramoyl-L-alanine--D-glutamate ligase [Gemmatimonadota bacterium]
MNEERSLSGAKVAIIGLGVSGAAAARLALAKGGEVYVSDLRTDAPAAAGGAELRALGADVEWGRHDVERVARADLVVVSPGIPPQAPVLRKLARRGVPWISEPEFAVRFYRGQLIAVTGTNGKTTTAVLTAHLLESAGIPVALGGNVGASLAPAASELALRDPAPDWYVLEISSFQLGAVERLRPDVGVVTNLAPDHLDYYASVEAYYADKANLFRNADETSRWVLPAGDAAVAELAGDAPGQRHFFGWDPEAGTGVGAAAGRGTGDGAGSGTGAEAAATPAGMDAFVRDGVMALRGAAAEVPLIPVEAFPLLGRHNVMNALAASLTASVAGAPAEALRNGLRRAAPLPHRLEPVAERDGVLWVNDSKATNVAAACSAVRSMSRPVVLLLGGQDKGEDFSPLLEAMEGVRAVVVYGAAAGRIAAALEHAAPVTRVEGGLEAVVAEAARMARPGDVVLLAPACSSFDMFRNYEERGRTFRALVEERS